MQRIDGKQDTRTVDSADGKKHIAQDPASLYHTSLHNITDHSTLRALTVGACCQSQ